MTPVRRSWSPEKVHAILGLSVAVTLTLGLMLFLPWTSSCLLLAWLVGINLTTFAWFGYDKGQAIAGSRRVPEVVLHGMALVGGSAGAIVAMRLFRHKTIKPAFRMLFGMIVVLQGLFLVWWTLTFLGGLLLPVLIGAGVGGLLTWWAFTGSRSRLAGSGTKVQ